MKHVLILRGVKLDSISLRTEKPQPTTVNSSDDINYDKIPREYTRNTWPRGTNLRCWSCGRRFNSQPFFVATKALKDVEGNFCHPACAMTFIDAEVTKINRWDAVQQLYELVYQLTGRKVQRIMPAPKRFMRAEYGGPLSDADFEEQLSSALLF